MAEFFTSTSLTRKIGDRTFRALIHSETGTIIAWVRDGDFAIQILNSLNKGD